MEQEGRILNGAERSNKLLLHRAAEEALSDLGGQCRAAGVMRLGEQSMVGRADVHSHKGRVVWSRANPWRCSVLSLRSVVQVKAHGNDYEGGPWGKSSTVSRAGVEGVLSTPSYPLFSRSFIHIRVGGRGMISPWERRVFLVSKILKNWCIWVSPPCELWTFDTFSLFFLFSEILDTCSSFCIGKTLSVLFLF